MRKILSMVLAAIMLALPVLGLAATPEELMQKGVAGNRALETTVSFEPGTLTGDEKVVAAVKDMLSALSVHSVVAATGQYAHIEFLLSGKPVLSHEMAMSDGVFALKNSLIGDSVLTLAKEDVKPFLTRLVKLLESQQVEISNVDQFIDQVEAQFAAMPVQAATIPMEDAEKAFLQSFEALFEKGDEVEALDTAGEFSPVVLGKKVTLTADMLKEFFSAMMEKTGQNKEVLGQLNRALDTFFANVTDASATMYYNADKAPVLLELKLSVPQSAKPAEASAKTEPVDIQLHIGKVDVDGVVSTKAHLKVSSKANEDKVVHGVMTVSPSPEKTTVNGELSLVSSEGTAQRLTLQAVKNKAYGDTEATETYEGTLEVVLSPDRPDSKVSIQFQGDEKTVFDGKDAESVGQVTVSAPFAGIEGLKVKGVTKTVDVPVMDRTDAKDVGKMTEEELTGFAQTVTFELMGAVGNILQSLPASVTELLMNNGRSTAE